MKIVVPEGMLEAALDGVEELAGVGVFGMVGIRTALEAALCWLAENPVVPGHIQTIGLCQVYESRSGDYCQSIRDVATEWQRRMFLAPDLPPDPLVMYVMRHFEDVVGDKLALRNRAEAAVADYQAHYDHGRVNK